MDWVGWLLLPLPLVLFEVILILYEQPVVHVRSI